MILSENPFNFDVSPFPGSDYHDHRGDGNTNWSGVDFRIPYGTREFWVEVKSYDLTRIEPRRRGGVVQQFKAKMKSKHFADELMSKFYGTACYRSVTGHNFPDFVFFVVLIQEF